MGDSSASTNERSVSFSVRRRKSVLRRAPNSMEEELKSAWLALLLAMTSGLLVLNLEFGRSNKQQALASGSDSSQPIGATCEQDDHGCSRFEGRIGREFVAFIERQPDRALISITSPGGWARSALEASELIREKRLSATILDECSSACVDFLLPSFERVILSGHPLIAAHGNPVAAQASFHLLSPGAPSAQIPDSCRTDSEWLSLIWRETGTNGALLNRLTAELGLERLEPMPRECPRLVWHNDPRLLSGAEVRSVFGNKVSGGTCRDDNSCRWRLGSRRLNDLGTMAVGSPP